MVSLLFTVTGHLEQGENPYFDWVICGILFQTAPRKSPDDNIVRLLPFCYT